MVSGLWAAWDRESLFSCNRGHPAAQTAKNTLKLSTAHRRAGLWIKLWRTRHRVVQARSVCLILASAVLLVAAIWLWGRQLAVGLGAGELAKSPTDPGAAGALKFWDVLLWAAQNPREVSLAGDRQPLLLVVKSGLAGVGVARDHTVPLHVLCIPEPWPGPEPAHPPRRVGSGSSPSVPRHG